MIVGVQHPGGVHVVDEKGIRQALAIELNVLDAAAERCPDGLPELTELLMPVAWHMTQQGDGLLLANVFDFSEGQFAIRRPLNYSQPIVPVSPDFVMCIHILLQLSLSYLVHVSLCMEHGS